MKVLAELVVSAPSGPLVQSIDAALVFLKSLLDSLQEEAADEVHKKPRKMGVKGLLLFLGKLGFNIYQVGAGSWVVVVGIMGRQRGEGEWHAFSTYPIATLKICRGVYQCLGGQMHLLTMVWNISIQSFK
jgi:hypothetical protein